MMLQELLDHRAAIEADLIRGVDGGKIDPDDLKRPLSVLTDRRASLTARVAALEALRTDTLARLDAQIAALHDELGTLDAAVGQMEATVAPAGTAAAPGGPVKTRAAKPAKAKR